MTLQAATGPQYSRTPLICESVLSGAVNKTYAPKQDVFYEGEPKRSVYKIEVGAVSLYKTMADGRRQIFDFAFAGDVIGLGASKAHSCSAQTVGQAQLKSLPVSRLYQLAERDPSFALGLYQAVSSELETTRDLLLTLGQHDSIERVAIFLLTLSQRNSRNGQDPCLLTIPMTRADIADLLGMTIETVSRSLTKLRELELITMIRASTIQIIDLNRLRTLAGRINRH